MSPTSSHTTPPAALCRLCLIFWPRGSNLSLWICEAMNSVKRLWKMPLIGPRLSSLDGGSLTTSNPCTAAAVGGICRSKMRLLERDKCHQYTLTFRRQIKRSAIRMEWKGNAEVLTNDRGTFYAIDALSPHDCVRQCLSSATQRERFRRYRKHRSRKLYQRMAKFWDNFFSQIIVKIRTIGLHDIVHALSI